MTSVGTGMAEGLELRGLNVFHGRAQALRDVSLSLAAGEVLCLFGRNGAGKTTTLRTIMGSLRPASGQVLLDGVDLTRLPAHRIPGKGVAHVPQGRRLFAELSVRENLEIGLGAGRKRGAPFDRAPLKRALSLFPVLGERMGQVAGTLSGGEQTMLAVGRAICAGPRFILMDEPTEGLMPAAIATIRDAIVRLRSEGTGVLLVEQRVAAALLVADRVAFMDHGRIAGTFPVAEVRTEPELISRYLGV